MCGEISVVFCKNERSKILESTLVFFAIKARFFRILLWFSVIQIRMSTILAYAFPSVNHFSYSAEALTTESVLNTRSDNYFRIYNRNIYLSSWKLTFVSVEIYIFIDGDLYFLSRIYISVLQVYICLFFMRSNPKVHLNEPAGSYV